MNQAFLLSVTLVVPILFPPLASGDDLEDLKRRVSEMRQENERLRAQIEEQSLLLEELAKRVEGVPAGEAPQPPPTAPAEVSPELSAEESSTPPQLFLRGFVDTTAFARTAVDGVADSESAFALNELDLLLTSQLASELSVLSEIVFHFEEIEEDAFFEVERIYLKYSPTDLLNVQLGRMHTALGYWNQTFHHGSWFQTTVRRPQIFLFEDDGGVLPVHSVGVELFGTKQLFGLDLDYSAAVVNGRGRSLRVVQNVRDANQSKGVNLRLNVDVPEVPGLAFGLTGYFDEFPESEEPARGPLDERILGGHFVYTREGTEFLAELLQLHHRDPVMEEDYDTLGLYVQGAYQVRRWKPYYRFDYVNIDEADPLFTTEQYDLRRHTLGARWDVSTWLALKFEYEHEKRPGLFQFQAGGVQAAFSF
jgi:hypothetical protein